MPDRLALALIVGGLTVAAGVLRIVFAGQDLFADELSTYWIISTNDLVGVVDTVSTTAEITPPLSFVLSWLATRIDLSAELLRFPALLGGIVTVPVVFMVGLRSVGRDAALLATALTALSPFMVYYSAEARGYGLMMALVLLSTLAVLLAIDSGRRRWWVVYALLICAAVYTHYTALFVLAVQFLWIIWAHPELRRTAIVASAAAAVGFALWLPGLKADLDSPTTKILSSLSPFNLDTIEQSLQHWSIGFPYSQFSELTDVPGTLALILLGLAAVAGIAGIASNRAEIRRRLVAGDRRIALIIALALATPVGEAVASLIGSDVFGTRNLAASWAYFALAFAALLTAGRAPLRIAAAILAIVAFAIGAVSTLSVDYERPNYEQVADFIEQQQVGVVIDAAPLTPGPLANSDVSFDSGSEVFRAGIPEQKVRPFSFSDRPPDPASVAERAVEAAGGGPIALIATVTPNPIPGRPSFGDLAGSVIDELPPDYQLAEQREFRGLLDLQALIYARAEVQPG